MALGDLKVGSLFVIKSGKRSIRTVVYRIVDANTIWLGKKLILPKNQIRKAKDTKGKEVLDHNFLPNIEYMISDHTEYPLYVVFLKRTLFKRYMFMALLYLEDKKNKN